MGAGELLRGGVVDESLVKQPLDGPALASNIAQGMPRRDQFGVVFMDLVLESSERSPPLQRLGQASAGRAVADAVSKVGHVLKPHVGRERVDGDEIELVNLDGVLPIDASVAGPESYLARSRVEQPSVFVVSLIRECVGDLLNVESVQVEHLLRVEPEPDVKEEACERRRVCRPARGRTCRTDRGRTGWPRAARYAAEPRIDASDCLTWPAGLPYVRLMTDAVRATSFLNFGHVLASIGAEHDPTIELKDVLVIRHIFRRDEPHLHGPEDLTDARVLAYTRGQEVSTKKFPAVPAKYWVVLIADGKKRSRLFCTYRNHGEVVAERTETGRCYDLRKTDFLAPLEGRLVIDWANPLSWYMHWPCQSDLAPL